MAKVPVPGSRLTTTRPTGPERRRRRRPETIATSASSRLASSSLPGLARDCRRPRTSEGAAPDPPRGSHHRPSSTTVVGGAGIRAATNCRFGPARLEDSVAPRACVQEVREARRPIVYVRESVDAGQVAIYVGTRPDSVGRPFGGHRRGAAACRRALHGEELERAKENVKGRTVLSMESMLARMDRLGGAVVCDVPALTLDEVLARIDAVSAEDVEAARRPSCGSPEPCRPPAWGSAEEPFRAALDRVHPALAACASSSPGAWPRTRSTWRCPVRRGGWGPPAGPSSWRGGHGAGRPGRSGPRCRARRTCVGDADVVVDFSQPRRRARQRPAVPRGGRALRDGHDRARLPSSPGWAAATCSWRPTSPSAPC